MHTCIHVCTHVYRVCVSCIYCPFGSHLAHMGQVARWQNSKRQVADATRPTWQFSHLALSRLWSTWHFHSHDQNTVTVCSPFENITENSCHRPVGHAPGGPGGPGGLCARWAPGGLRARWASRQVGAGSMPGGCCARWARWSGRQVAPGGLIARWLQVLTKFDNFHAPAPACATNLAEPKQSGQIGPNLIQIARLPWNGIRNLAVGLVSRLEDVIIYGVFGWS